MEEYNENLEIKAMFNEDLKGKLL